MLKPELDPHRFANLHRAGFRVFPLTPRGKEPALKWTEFRDREPTEQELLAWDASEFNIGIICGPLDDGDQRGIAVLDVDSQDAQEAIDALELPPTPSVRTGKGRHYYFKMPPQGLRNRVGLGGAKLDVRARGGYVVAPGSIHPTGARYEWETKPDEVDLGEFPVEPLGLDQQDQIESGGAGPSVIVVPEKPGPERFIAYAVNEACENLAQTEEGSRNNELFKRAVRVAAHVAAAGADWQPIAEALGRAAATAGLQEDEICATLLSAYERGKENPTGWIAIAKEHIYLGGPERFVHLRTGDVLSPSGFNGMFGQPHKGKPSSFANYLLQQGFIAKAREEVYEPELPQGVIYIDGEPYFNSYRPSEVEAAEGDPPRFIEFLEYLFPDEVAREHMLKAMAFTVRNPGQKLRHSIMLRSRVQGVGKSLLVQGVWAPLMGRSNVRLTTSDEIQSQFASWLKGNTLCVCEELNIAVGMQVYNRLKDWITNDRAIVNEKNKIPREWKACSTFVFLSNLEVPMLIEDTDRRVFLVDIASDRRNQSYYSELAGWFSANLGVVRAYLDQVDLTDFDPFAPPPITAAKRQLMLESRSVLARDIAFHIEDRTAPLQKDVVTIDQIRHALGGQAFRLSDRKIAMALRELGARRLGQCSLSGSRPVLWAIRRPEIWCEMTLAELADEYRAERGLFADFDEAGVTVCFDPPDDSLAEFVWQGDIPHVSPQWFTFGRSD